MAQPTFQFANNFESGDFTGWDVSESDTSSQLSVAHYTTLARKNLPMPYSGAYAMLLELASGNTNDATVGDGDIDILDGETFWFLFNIWIDPNLGATLGAGDNITLLELQQTTGNGVIYSFGIQYDFTNNQVHWGIGEAVLGTVVSASSIELGRWHTVELKVNVQTAAATGEIELYVTADGEEPSSTALATDGSNQSAAAVVRGILGAQDKLSGMTGSILIDNFQMRATNRIWPQKDRFSTSRTINQSEHVFVGAGTVNSFMLASSNATNNVITVYDTDMAQAYPGQKKLVLANTSANETIMHETPIEFERGCYVEITGTAYPEVIVDIQRAPAWFSEGNMRRFALSRRLTR